MSSRDDDDYDAPPRRRGPREDEADEPSERRRDDRYERPRDDDRYERRRDDRYDDRYDDRRGGGYGYDDRYGGGGGGHAYGPDRRAGHGIDYEPRRPDDYRRMLGENGKYLMLGSLGVDTDTEEHRKARARAEAIKEFDRQAREQNKI